jgi:hypothetical protein
MKNEVKVMKDITLAGTVIAVVLSLLMPSIVLAVPVGKITHVEGQVDVLKTGRQAVAKVAQGDDVDVGDIFRTKSASRAEIIFTNKNVLKIDPATRVEINQYLMEGDKSSQVMKLQRGKVQAISGEDFIKKVTSAVEGNKFEVHTPNAVAGIRGSHMIVGFARLTTALVFRAGKGYFYNPLFPNRIVNITGGFMSFIVGSNGIPTPPRPGNEAYLGGNGIAPVLGRAGSGPDMPIVNASMNMPYIFTQQPMYIPSVLVGSATLTGTGTTVASLTFQNMGFYGPSATSVPQTWKVGTVTGTFLVGTPSDTLVLSGGGLTSTVNINWGGGAWNATVAGNAPTGIGAVNQAFQFSGTGSGTYNTLGGAITGGTASGTVP